LSATATKDKTDETADEAAVDEVKPERVPADTAAELERVKQIIGAQLGLDMRSPGQVAQAELDEEEAQAQLEAEQKQAAEEEAKAEAEAAKAEAEAEKAATKK